MTRLPHRKHGGRRALEGSSRVNASAALVNGFGRVSVVERRRGAKGGGATCFVPLRRCGGRNEGPRRCTRIARSVRGSPSERIMPPNLSPMHCSPSRFAAVIPTSRYRFYPGGHVCGPRGRAISSSAVEKASAAAPFLDDPLPRYFSVNTWLNANEACFSGRLIGISQTDSNRPIHSE